MTQPGNSDFCVAIGIYSTFHNYLPPRIFVYTLYLSERTLKVGSTLLDLIIATVILFAFALRTGGELLKKYGFANS
jgi:hypothetical protein